MDFKKNISNLTVVIIVFALSSCGGQKNLIIPRAISTAEAIPAVALNLKKGDYDILKSVTQTASITATYSNNSLKIVSGDGDFSYSFKFDQKNGWRLDKFSGTATFGYLLQDVQDTTNNFLDAEEFARRVAISKLIDVVKDYSADGALEPIVSTRASNVKKNVVEYQATVTAKIVKIHTTN